MATLRADLIATMTLLMSQQSTAAAPPPAALRDTEPKRKDADEISHDVDEAHTLVALMVTDRL